MSDIVIPNHLQIETVAGYCTCNCIMCNIDKFSGAKKIMPTEEFKKILMRFEPIKSDLHFLTLLGLGEPLIDKEIANKIHFAKQNGFKGTGLATNLTELNSDCSTKLQEAGLDTIIFSIDGIKKETHESIRVGTNFDEVHENALNFLKLRKKLGTKTRVLVRFITQDKNRDEWGGFKKYWESKLDADMKDDVLHFDVIDLDAPKVKHNQNFICKDIYEKIIVNIKGNLQFCCSGDFFKLPSVFDQDPIEIYNNETFSHYRDFMKKNRVSELKNCNTCQYALNQQTKSIPKYIEV